MRSTGPNTRDAAGGTANQDPAFQTASEHLFGSVGLMYALWFPADQQNGKTMLLVGKDASSLSTDRVLSRVKTAGNIGEIGVWYNGRPAGRYYYRLVTGYQAGAGASGATDAGRDD